MSMKTKKAKKIKKVRDKVKDKNNLNNKKVNIKEKKDLFELFFNNYNF